MLPFSLSPTNSLILLMLDCSADHQKEADKPTKGFHFTTSCRNIKAENHET